MQPERLTVVIPTLDDWASLTHLLTELGTQQASLPPVHVIVVNDGSITAAPNAELARAASALAGLQIVELATNLGHQRAIATGLAVAVREGTEANTPNNLFAVMDADGEDRPSDLPTLVQNMPDAPADRVVAAQRASRSEGLRFRAFYRLYRAVFHLLTGRQLDFGNFVVLSPGAVNRLLHSAETWNNIPASIMRSRMPITRIPVHRGERYADRSRMSFISLVNHGLGAISVFVDVVFVRILVVTVLAFIGAIAFAIAALIVRLVTGSPLPGWFALSTTVAVSGLITILAVLVLSAFTLLANRAAPAMVPATAALQYVTRIRRPQ